MDKKEILKSDKMKTSSENKQLILKIEEVILGLRQPALWTWNLRNGKRGRKTKNKQRERK